VSDALVVGWWSALSFPTNRKHQLLPAPHMHVGSGILKFPSKPSCYLLFVISSPAH
jgi:hypothetical protein